MATSAMRVWEEKPRRGPVLVGRWPSAGANGDLVGKAGPILKWAGGKGRLFGELEARLPSGEQIRRHVEPFFGGGAFFFGRRPERAVIADVNPSLVATYRAVQGDVEEVIRRLMPLAARHSIEHYYQVRDRYNRAKNVGDADRAAMFIYLNKTCFNGLHRVNRKGEFNVPAGRYKNPTILNADALRSASALLKRADIRHDGFEALLRYAKPGDFIYLDPPYAPVSETANFTAYTLGGFGTAEQGKLAEVFRALDKRGCRLMLSNSDVPMIRKLYKGFLVEQIMAPRAINSKATRRGRVAEVVVRNYGDPIAA